MLWQRRYMYPSEVADFKLTRGVSHSPFNKLYKHKLIDYYDTEEYWFY